MGPLMSCHPMWCDLPQDFFAMIVPPLFKPVNLILRIGGFACGLSARIAHLEKAIRDPDLGIDRLRLLEQDVDRLAEKIKLSAPYDFNFKRQS